MKPDQRNDWKQNVNSNHISIDGGHAEQCYAELQSIVGRPRYENASRYVQVSCFYELLEKCDG